MAGSVESLRLSCAGVVSDKLKERRESADTLQCLLTNSELCQQLHDSAAHRSDGFGWTQVLQSSVTFFQKELTKVEMDSRAGRNQSSVVQLARNAISLVENVAKKANSGRSRLDVSQLVDVLVSALRHPFRRDIIGADLCAFAEQVLLQAPVVSEIKLAQWRELLSAARALVRDRPDRLPAGTALSLLAEVAAAGCRQTALLASVHALLPTVDEHGLPALRSSHGQLDASTDALRLITVVCTLMLPTARRAVCELSTRAFNPVLLISRACNKEELVNWLQLTLCARSPRCDRAEYAAGPAEWQAQLRQMYQLVMDQVEPVCTQMRGSRGADGTALLPPHWLRLFSWVAHLLFEEDEQLMDVTQLASVTAAASTADPCPAKRRRLAVGVQPLYERCHQLRDSLEAVPWLQLLTALLQWRPQQLSAGQLLTTVQLLVVWLSADSRRPQLVRQQLQLAAALLRCPAAAAAGCAEEWRRLGQLAVKASTLVRCQEPAHCLLQQLLIGRQLRPDAGLLQLYQQLEAVVAGPTLLTLVTLLRHHPLPPPASVTADPLHTRRHLIGWLLTADGTVSPHQVAEALTRLVLRDTTVPLPAVQDANPPLQDAQDEIAQLSDLYCRTELIAPFSESTDDAGPAEPAPFSGAAIGSLRDEVLSALERQLSEAAASDAAERTERWCVQQAGLCRRALLMLMMWCGCGLVESSQLQSLSVARSLAKLLGSLLSAAGDHVKVTSDESTDGVSSLLKALEELFSSVAAEKDDQKMEATNQGRRTVASLVISSIPTVFPAICLKLLEDRAGVLVPVSMSMSDPMTDRNDRVARQFDSRTRCTKDESLLTCELNDLEQIRMDVCKVLLQMASADLPVDWSGELDGPDLITQVLECLLNHRLNVGQVGDLRLALHLLRAVPRSPAVRDVHLVELSGLLLCLCRQWPRHATIVEAVLLVMADGYLQRIADTGSPRDRKDAMKFVGTMQAKLETARYGERCLLAHLRLLALLAKLDPVGEWAVKDGEWAVLSLLVHLSAPAEPSADFPLAGWSTHRSRMLAADLLQAVFSSGESASTGDVGCVAPTLRQMFDEVRTAAFQCLSPPEASSSAGEEQEDPQNRPTALCTALARMALGSGVCRPLALLALCRAAREPNVPLAIVRKTVKLLASSLGAASPRVMFTPHLPWLLQEWIGAALPVLEFPYTLLEFATVEEFISTHLVSVVPPLLMRSDAAVSELATALQRQPRQLVLASVPQLVAADLSRSAASQHTNVLDAARNVVGSDALNDEVLSHPSEVVTAVLRAHRSAADGPAPYLRRLVDTVFGCGLVPALLRSAGDAVQRVLLSLATDAAEATAEIRVPAAQAYCAMVHLLAREFAELGDTTAFVMYGVPASIAHQLSELSLPRDSSLAILYADTLILLCEECLAVNLDMLCARLEMVCGAILPLCEESNHVKDVIEEKLSDMLSKVRDLRPDLVSSITSLPEHLASQVEKPSAAYLEKLSTAEPLTLCALEATLASVEAAETVPRCPPGLLTALLRVTAETGAERRRRRAAARLLGALGAQPLTTPTLRPRPQPWRRCGADGGDQSRDAHLLWTLHQLLTDRQPAVVAAAADALRAVLAEPSATLVMDMLNTQMADFKSQLWPFYVTRKRAARHRTVSRVEALKLLDSEQLWSPLTTGFQAWLCSLTLSMLEVGAQVSPELAVYIPVCRVKGASFCRVILPYATRAALLSDQQLRGVLGARMGHLLQDCARLVGVECAAEPDLSDAMTSVRLQCADAVLLVVLYLRRQPLPDGWGVRDSAWQRHFWLQLSMTAAAGAALACGFYCEAVLLAEVGCYQRGGELASAAALLPATADGDRPRWLLWQAHARLGDADGVAALRGTGDDAGFQEQQGDWLGALAGYDYQSGASATQAAAQAGLLRCLAQLQLFGCSAMLLRGMTAHLAGGEPTPAPLTEAACEAAWRLADWTSPLPSCGEAGRRPGLQQALYGCLSALGDDDTAAARRAVNDGRAAALAALTTVAAPPSVHALNLCLSRLRLLREAELLCDCDDDAELSRLCARWREETQRAAAGTAAQFGLQEPTLAYRAALLQVLRQRRPRLKSALEARRAVLVQLSDGARSAGQLPAAERAVSLLLSVQTGAASAAPADPVVGRCVAELWWARGDPTRALLQCRSLLDEPGGGAADSWQLRRAELLVRYAGWLSEQHADTPRAILEQQLTPAIQQLEAISQDPGAEAALVEAHHMAGRYADQQFQRVDQLVASQAFADRKAEVEQLRSEAALFRRKAATAAADSIVSRDMRCQEMRLSRTADLDAQELQQHETERATFQRRAVASYVRCLQLSDRRQLLMYRLVALWLADDSGQVCAQLEPAAPALASHQFVSLLQQLAARLGRPGWDARSATLLESLLLRCAEEHPHHALPVLMALRHGREDPAVAGPAPDVASQQRTAAAGRLLDQLRSRLDERVSQLERVDRELIRLAYQPTKKDCEWANITGSCNALAQEGVATAVAVQTVPIAVRPDGDYSAVPTVVRWDRKFEMVGGVNAPKKLRCLGSDGRWRLQLLKGRDDLRQDAVMQQVFSVLNQLLRQSAGADQSPLAIRCYKVVPLSQRSGLIEWCVDTQPIGNYLTGSGGAHSRYRPQDMAVRDARRMMTDNAKKSVERRRAAFADICSRLQPVFRHFFWERFPEPSEWFERRVAYTNSVAAASMSGYVLGLGDRHVSNILIDQVTAEVIHIDLGVAFETGRLLPTPETVPFRLTRDMVDGMGVTGVRGRFERSCRRTLDVLRQNSEVIMTIVRVLLEDPLYAWTLTAEKASRVQKQNVPERQDNRQAERTLERLAEKLRGQQGGRTMSCAAQVSHLIQQARDPDNLSLLFSGWQPYL